MARVVTYLGRTFRVHPEGDYLSDVLAVGDPWEPDVIDAVISAVEGRHGAIIDAGAMLGTHTVAWAVTLPHHHIHAFEPSTVNLPLLRENVRDLSNVTVWPFALSDREGYAEAVSDPANRGHAAIMETDPWSIPGDTEMFVTAPLDSLGLRVVAIKADVEWHEARLLAGAARTIERDRPVIVVEDWSGELAPPEGYVVTADWSERHQTRMWAPA